MIADSVLTVVCWQAADSDMWPVPLPGRGDPHCSPGHDAAVRQGGPGPLCGLEIGKSSSLKWCEYLIAYIVVSLGCRFTLNTFVWLKIG